ncbi:hypothetical protein DYB28_000674, partial [Aphanomyces astaci]
MASPTTDSVNSDAITLPKELRSGDDAQRVESATLTRESGAHEAFARSRMDGFVYVETPPYMHVLDGHCRFEFENGTSPLMVVLGHPASGKSALLVNWVHQRLKKQQPGPEVIFQHYCGCSYESVKVHTLLEVARSVNTPRDLASVHCILDSKGSSCPLYLRLVLTMLDQSSHHPQPEYLQSLLLHASDFPSLYELVLQQWKAILLADLVDTLDHLTCKAAASVDPPPQLDRPDSRKRNSRRDSEHMTLVASQLSPEEDEINRTKMQMERRALLARHALSLFTVSRFG